MSYNCLAAKKENNKYNCILCNYNTSNKKDYAKHIKTKKQTKREKIYKTQ